MNTLSPQAKAKASEKAIKALRLAHNNNNANERETALRQAYKLIAAYALDQATIEHEALGLATPPERADIDIEGFEWQSRLCVAIARLCYCVTFKQKLKSNRTAYAYHYVGRPSYCITAIKLHEYLTTSVSKEAKSNHYRKGTHAYTSFCDGAVDTLILRINEIIANAETDNAPSSSTALILYNHRKSEQLANIDWLAEQGIRLIKSVYQTTYRNTNAYNHGREYAQSLSLNRQIARKHNQLTKH